MYTRFTRRADVWRLAMGVVGDRVPPSVVVAPQPFMGPSCSYFVPALPQDCHRIVISSSWGRPLVSYQD